MPRVRFAFQPTIAVSMAISVARVTAFDILRKVEAGGYASDLLRAQTAALDSRDAGLSSEIVFGVLRYQAQLDYLIEYFSGRRQKLDGEVRTALRMGIYQLRYLERVPAHAAVTESVELVKRAHKRSAAGFVNAVLRKVTRDPVEWPSREVELSCPEWLLARWDRNYGTEIATGIARAALEAGVRAVAGDLSHRRIAQMKGLTPDLVVLDGTRPLPFAGTFDRILVDAPCSGTGTLGRNPEIKWRLTPADLEELPRRQASLLASARAALAPGGLLVYSTCSLEPEENEGVVATVPTTLIVETMRRIPGRDAGDGFEAAVIKSE